MRKLKITALLLALALSLTGCQQNGAVATSKKTDINVDPSPDAIRNLTLWNSPGADQVTLNVFHSQFTSDHAVSGNLFDGLFGVDADGVLRPWVAKDASVSEDGLTWTVHLIDNCYWVDSEKNIRGVVTSADFAQGVEWTINFHKNGAVSVQMIVDYIEGAQEYLDYTSSLSEEEGKALKLEKFKEMVGIETPDDYTIIYHLKAPCSYFDTVLSYPTYYPASVELLEEIGVDRFLISAYYEIWYNGPYIMAEYVPGNEKIYDPNPYWYGNDSHTRFESVTMKCLENSATALQLYKTGEVDRVGLGQSQLKAIMSDPDSPYYDQIVSGNRDSVVYFMSFNYDRRFEDGTPDLNWDMAASNEAFRRSFYYGLDLTAYLKFMNPIEPYALATDTLVSPNLAAFSDGRDYTEEVKKNLGLSDSDGTGLSHLDHEKAMELKKQAMKELSAMGVTFPVEVNYYVSGANQSTVDQGKLLRDIFEECLGSDYVKMNLKTYVNSFSTEVVKPGLASIITVGWNADFGDPSSTLGQFLFDDENAYYTTTRIRLNQYNPDFEGTPVPDYLEETIELAKEYTRLYREANAIFNDNDARFEAFAKAESFAIEHSVFAIPFYQSVPLMLTRVDVSSVCKTAYGGFTTRYVDWKTSVNGYTRTETGKEAE